MKVHRLAPQRDDSLSSRTASEDSEFGNQSDGDTFQPSRDPDYAQQFSHRDPMQLTRLALAKLTPAPPTQLDIHVCSAMSGESKRITQSVQIKSTIFHLRDEINAAFAKPPGTPLQISWASDCYRLAPSDSSISYLTTHDRPKCSCMLSGCPAHNSEG